jgi:hypothetical protein
MEADPSQVRGQDPPFDFWPYFESIPVEDMGGHDFTGGVVDQVFRMPSGAHEHVLIACERRNVYLVLVLNLSDARVLGHHLLDLNRLYRLS